METMPGGLDNMGRKHYKLTACIVYFMFILMLFKMIWGAGAMLYLGTRPSGSIQVIDTGSTYRVELPAGHIQMDYRNFPGHFYQTAPDGKIFAISFLGVSMLTQEIPWILILYFAVRLIRKMGEGHSPFLPETTVCIKKIGIIFLWMGCLGTLVWQIGISALVFGEFFIDNPIKWELLGIGAIVLFLGDVFQKGCALQQEADETL